MSESDRKVDPVQEGGPRLAIRPFVDSDMVGLRVAIPRRTCATPGISNAFGAPVSIAILDGDRIVGIRSLTSAICVRWDFIVDGEGWTPSSKPWRYLKSPAREGREEVELPTYSRLRPQSAYTVLTLRGIADNVSKDDPEGSSLSL